MSTSGRRTKTQSAGPTSSSTSMIGENSGSVGLLLHGDDRSVAAVPDDDEAGPPVGLPAEEVRGKDASSSAHGTSATDTPR